MASDNQTTLALAWLPDDGSWRRQDIHTPVPSLNVLRAAGGCECRAEPDGASWRRIALPQTTLDQTAALLRAAGWTVVPPSPPPVVPRVGMRVRYLRSEDWGPSRGDVGTIIQVREPSEKDGHARAPVFWVRLDNYPGSQFYTTPRDVEALPDAE